MLRVLCSIVLIAPLFCCSRGPAVVDAGDTEVSPERRLADYLNYSRFPDSSRPARPDTPDLEGLVTSQKNALSSAVIQGWDGEELRGGSLFVYLKVQVHEPGRYSFRAVLEDADGKKTAVVTETKDLRPGTPRVGLMFYGLIFHETKWKSPFRLRGAAGERLATDDDLARAVRPDGTVKAPPEGRLNLLRADYHTKSYTHSDFTKAVWDSPEKQAKIRSLEAEIRAAKSR